jgi:hypothetical protein
MVMNKQLFVLIAAIALLAAITRGQVQTDLAKSASETLTRFCTMDAAGNGLSAHGWKQLGEMFNRPSASRPTHAIISSRGFNVSNARIEGDKAHFYVEYLEVAQIDDLAHFETLPGPHHTRVLYTLILTTEKNNAALKEGEGRLEWKIDGHQIEPRITVETAKRYVTELRDTTKDPVVKKNADRTLASLVKLQ